MSIITVLNNNDSGAGSLRAALTSAQSGDTIAFASSLSNQTITLSSRLDIADGKNLTIDGAAASGLKISGNNANQIFNVNSTSVSQTQFTLENVILSITPCLSNGSTGAWMMSQEPVFGGASTTTLLRQGLTASLTSIRVEQAVRAIA